MEYYLNSIKKPLLPIKDFFVFFVYCLVFFRVFCFSVFRVFCLLFFVLVFFVFFVYCFYFNYSKLRLCKFNNLATQFRCKRPSLHLQFASQVKQ